MSWQLSPEVLDQILPFSFITNDQGQIHWLGRSIKKLFPTLKEASPWNSFFEFDHASNQSLGSEPQSLNGELILLREKSATRAPLRLRCHVIDLKGLEPTYLFAVNPSVGDSRELASSGMTYDDFSLGDSIFDFLMLIQSERRSHARSEIARKQLLWENRCAEVLRKIALLTSETLDTSQALILSVEVVCLAQGWDFGHAFVRCADDTGDFESIKTSFCTDRKRYREFKAMTEAGRFALGYGLPGRVAQSGKSIWSDNLIDDPLFPRREALEGVPLWCGVAIPVRLGGQVMAVLEFFAAKPMGERELYLRFFDILSGQLGAVVERHESSLREKAREAQLLISSNLSSLGEMAAGVAHEINNPLTTILLGVSQSIEQIKKPEPDLTRLASLLERIKRSGDRIHKIVAGMGMLSRDGGADPFATEPLSRIVDETVPLCAARFRHGSVELQIPDPSFGGLQIHCRIVQISQVLLNLLNNAFDAVQGTPGAWVRVIAHSDGMNAIVEVSDSGNGITSAIAQKIMSPFFTTKPVGKGTGLGLSISRNIALNHQGSLDLDPSRETTTFVLRLPLASPTQPHA